MQYALQIFETEDRFPIRTVIIDGEPWFVFSDACRALDYTPKNGTFSRQADRLDEDQRRLVARSIVDAPSPVMGEGLDAPNGASLLCTNESGLYTLILRSEKPGAKEFRKWITSVVLPSIRKTGGYSTTPDAALGAWRPFHDRLNLAIAPVPEGYFSIFREMADMTAQLILQGVLVDDATIPDISLGQAWGKEWLAKGYDTEYGFRTTYEHNYPLYFRQAKSNPQWPWCYPEDALAVFRRWVRHTYIPTHYPQYLARKVKKGDMPAIVAEAALKAVTSAAPKALR